MIDPRLLICAAASILGHLAVVYVLDELPPREEPPVKRTVAVRVVPPPEPPAPEPPPPPPAPEPPPAPIEAVAPAPTPTPPPPRPAPRRVQKATPTPAPADTPETPAAPATTDAPSSTTAAPVFGVSMESTTQAPSGTAMPVGNTTSPAAPTGPTPGEGRPAPGPAPAAAHTVTKMPLPTGRCAGKYTEAARAAGVEGVVVLELVVDEQGRARDLRVVEGLSHGLNEAALAAARACRFTPGEKDGQPVAVRLRTFKIRFVLDER